MASKVDITVLSGVSAGDVFHFDVESTGALSVGRATECDLVLQDPMVSRKHLTVEKQADGYYIVDQGSTHGTFHMGFHLKAGAEGKRKLRNGDEFKIGEMLFRVNFDDKEFSPKQQAEAKPATGKAAATRLPPILRGKKGVAIVSLMAILLAFLLYPAQKSSIPPQKSGEIITVPSYGLVGFFRSAASGVRTEDMDFSHLDKAQFDIPASDVLIEYDIIGQSEVSVLLDGIPIDKIEPAPDSWQSRHLIIRGVAEGKERRLVFDNLAYPRDPKEGGPNKRWAVRDVRAAPLTTSYGVEPGFDNHLNSSLGLVEGIDKNAEGLFLLVRSLETAAVELLKELKIDAVSYRVDLGDDATKATDIAGLQQRLGAIKHGREQAFSAETSGNFLKELTRIIAQLDAELWRRVNNRMNAARLAARVKNFIEAHDQLMSAKGMFPEEADFRWTLANRMFTNKKIVPKNVRENPDAYRK